MDDITEEQKEVVDELRKRTINDVTPKMLEDVSLFYRFAKAREFDLKEAEVMLRNHIAWRKEFGMDTILTDYEPPEVLVKYVPSNFVCYDKDGCVVRFNDAGHTDLKGLMSASTKVEIGKYIAYIMERDRERVIKEGRNHGTLLYSVIYNFEDLSYSNAISLKVLQLSLYVMRIFIDHYPETVKRGFMINAPSYFSWFFSAIKPVIPATVIHKVFVYGKGDDNWKEDLLQFIDADELPAFLGGNKTDPDGNPLCETFILRGRPVPKSYSKSKKGRQLSLEPNVEKLTVLPMSREEVTFEVTGEDSLLEWEFETKHRDIGFSLLFREKPFRDFEPVELIPFQRIDTCSEPEKGYLKCEKLGTYSIVFDNSFSWIHSKEVYYRAGLRSLRNEDIYEAT